MSSSTKIINRSSQVITCKAAVAWGPGKVLVIEEVEVSPPQPNEIRIKVVCTSLCRSDVTAWQSQAIPIFPRIFGHEASGIVESVGQGVTEFQEGDHVLTLFTGECKTCRHCLSPQSNMCQNLGLERKGVMHSDQKTRFSIKGEPVFHYCAVSSFSEYTVVHSGCAVTVRPDVPLDKLCLFSCGVAAGLGAAWKVADISKQSTVVIFGLGTVGLSVALGAKLRGASQIIGVDTNPDKFEKARLFGITDVVNPADHEEPIHQVIKHMTSGGADYAFECVGDTGTITTALLSCCDGWGLTVTLGVPKVDPEVRAHYGLLLSGRTLKGTLIGGWKPKSDIPKLVDMYIRKFAIITLSSTTTNFPIFRRNPARRRNHRNHAAGTRSWVAPVSSSCLLKLAAVAWGPGKVLVIEEVEVSPPQPNEIRIKVVCTSLCRSDVTAWQSQAIPIFPRIFGHEASGIVESVGQGVTEFQEGDHVLTLFTGECKTCRHCLSPQSNMCQNLGLERKGVMHSDQKTRFSIKGEPVFHYCAVSSFSEYTVVHSGCAVTVRPDVPLDKLCLFSCGVAAGLGAAWKVADISKQSTVVIFGLGTVGLSVALGAKLRGASQIIGVDTNPDKFEKARLFGITDVVNPADHEEPIHQVIKHMTSGGADYAFECVGDTGTITTALLSCCDGWGLTVTLGVPKVDPEVRAHYGLLLSGRTLKGTLIGGWKPKSDIPKLVDMYIRKEIPIDQFITHNLQFEDINKAFNLMIGGNCLRCVIHMPK